jgi:tRNA pseudouridine38-40 synthase
MKNIKLIIAYEGTAYSGWQKTETGPSIEGELQKVLEQVLQHPVKLQAASRTDAGVHAEGQVVNFFTEKEVVLDRLMKSCNGLLPGDIRVLEIEEMPEAFHPTLDAKGKEYHYSVCLTPTQLPFDRRFSWHFVKQVDVELMRKAAAFFIGTHDFSALTNEKQDDNVREVYKIEIETAGGQKIRIRVAGNHFLYKMVRNIVGTLVYAGCGMLKIEEVALLLEKGDRTAAGMTAPAHGLSLKKVNYD